MNVFLNSAERLRSGWRFAVYFVFSAILLFLFAVPVTLMSQIFGGAFAKFLELNGFILERALVAAAFVVAGIICVKLLENLPLKSLGLSFTKNWLRDLVFGLTGGALSLLLAALIASFGGGMSFGFNREADFNLILQTIGISGVLFFVGALGEEAMFRGYALQTLARAGFFWLAVILTSVLFASVHASNPNVSIFALINTGLAGIWFGAAYWKTRTLWFPLGVHMSWNWTMAAFMGIPVSGITKFTPAPLFLSENAGPNWLTGGDYGLEGGAACTIALLISTLLIYFAPFINSTPEMLALTSQENPIETTFHEPPPPPIFNSTDDVRDFER